MGLPTWLYHGKTMVYTWLYRAYTMVIHGYVCLHMVISVYTFTSQPKVEV